MTRVKTSQKRFHGTRRVHVPRARTRRVAQEISYCRCEAAAAQRKNEKLIGFFLRLLYSEETFRESKISTVGDHTTLKPGKRSPQVFSRAQALRP